MANLSKSKQNIITVLFLVACGGLFWFLWSAPPETTVKLPFDKDHERFYAMAKKEAEKECGACHDPGAVSPLSDKHPDKYRCLFCHKKVMGKGPAS